MPRYRILLINSEFESDDEVDLQSLEAARKWSVLTAAKVVCESIAEGEIASAAEVQIYEGEELVSRQVVTLSVAELTAGK